MKKRYLAAAFILSLSAAFVLSPAANAEWEQTGEGYRWINEDGSARTERGWLTVGGKRYFIGKDGTTRHGLVKVGGKGYYFREDDEGSAYFGLKKIKGELYYFRTPEKGGAAVGWADFKGRRYYFDEKCRAVTGLYTIGGDTYFFDENGVMQTGLVYVDELVYDLGEDGILVSSYDEEEENKSGITWDMDEKAVRAYHRNSLMFRQGSMLVVKTDAGLRYYVFDKDSGVLYAYGIDSPLADRTEDLSGILEDDGYTLKEKTVLHKYDTLIYEKDGLYAAVCGNGSSSILLYASPALSEMFEQGGTDAITHLAAENGLPID